MTGPATTSEEDEPWRQQLDAANSAIATLQTRLEQLGETASKTEVKELKDQLAELVQQVKAIPAPPKAELDDLKAQLAALTDQIKGLQPQPNPAPVKPDEGEGEGDPGKKPKDPKPAVETKVKPSRADKIGWV